MPSVARGLSNSVNLRISEQIMQVLVALAERNYDSMPAIIVGVACFDYPF